MMRLLLAALAIIALSLPACAAHRGNSAALSSCPYGIDNGCAAANQSAQIIFPNYFTTVRQSGQGQYKASGGAGSDHPPGFNVPAVDYPVGQITADAGLKDPLLNLATADFTGCSFSAASHTITCGNGDQTFSGYNWNGIGLFKSNTSGNLTLTDNHFTMTGDNCRNYNGLANIRLTAGAMSLTNNTLDFNNECSYNAAIYKNIGDPGLVTQASFTASVSSNTMLVGSSSVGKIRVGQYVDYPGRGPVDCQVTGGSCMQITAFLAPAPVTISSITISGNIATVTTAAPHGLDVGAGLTMNGQTSTGYRGDAEVLSIPTSSSFTYQIPYYNTNPSGPASVVGAYSIRYLSGASANGSTWTVSGPSSVASAAFTTGPVLVTFNGPVNGASGDITAKYNAILGAGQFIGTGGSGNIDVSYNYEEIITSSGQHVNFVIGLPPAAPITIDYTHDGNNIWWSPYSTGNQGTGTLDLFTSSANASDNGPQTVTNFNVHNNVVIANKVLPHSSSNSTNALVRIIGQKGNGPDILYSQSGGVISVTYINGGSTSTQINTGNVAQCLNVCTQPIMFGTQLTGTPGGVGTYNSSNSVDTIAQLTASVASLTLTNGGSGCATAPSVSITGGGGSGATFTASISGGAVTGFTRTAAGSGYSSRPSATITGGGCSGVTATVVLTANGSSNTAYRVSNYNGTVNNVNQSGNYWDPTGADGVYNFDYANTWIGTINSTDNVNMLTGNSCNVSGACN